MTSFRFDETKSFDANLAAFLDHMATQDVEMGAILRVEAPKLKGATDESRRRAARTAFNNGVRAALDKLVTP